ncbi:unnamed protein product [Phytomonas sp. Hart1]|nr:unnamed protein product [Phytomonas sp. Hart1]|eukprot:CCW67320.1 unnamed protein product [Phytomonas sp. isolate Hart1]
MGPVVATYFRSLLLRQRLLLKLAMGGCGHWSPVRFIAFTHPHATDTEGRTAHGSIPLAQRVPTPAAFSSEWALEDPTVGIHTTGQWTGEQCTKGIRYMRVYRFETLEKSHRDELLYLCDLLTQFEQYRTAEARNVIANEDMKNSMECAAGNDSCPSMCHTPEKAHENRARRGKASTPPHSTPRVHGAFVACCIRCQVYNRDDGNGQMLANALETGPRAQGHFTSLRFTGVNYALHHCVNRGQTLSGILKGCAEQNAFGAVAASGQPYTAVSHIYLASGVSFAADFTELQGMTFAQRVRTKPLPTLDAGFPCPECWRHIERVALTRRDEQLPPLSLYLWVATEEAALCCMSRAKQKIARLQGYIDINFVVK